MQDNQIKDKSFFEFNSDNEPCIQDLIEYQAVKSPNSFAVICSDAGITYSELNQRANHLAHYLRKLGVGPEVLVGICVTRSVEMIVGILGILKAGGAYLPLDASYPQERLALILEDAHVQFVVTQSTLVESLPGPAARIICMDRDWLDFASASAENPQKITSAKDLAYVIYTSGSTGKPKGVMITHANLCHFVRIAHSALDVSEQDVYLHNASVAYALSVRQMMVPLSYGATIVLATSEQARDPILLFELIKTQKVTLMDVVPSFWRTAIQGLSDLSVDNRNLLLKNHLRRIVSIGEPLLFDIPNDWRIGFQHDANLINIFGQTETTGVVAAYPIPSQSQNRAGVVPIGRSTANTELYILDTNLQPVPVGEAGELCVSSPCLARGYLNRPELTAEKFISNPFNDGISDRLYRTGDLARYGEDGNIHLLGRGDYQVKIRGQRLELGEVEIVLREYQGVRDCVAVVRGDQPEDKYLAVYIVSSEKQNLTTDQLRRFMRKRVPDYMVPSVYVFLDALPLTPNGKIDRLALPDPTALTQSSAPRMIARPRNDTERKVANIWRDLLKLESVGIHDNFFDLGGHSFLAVRLFARIERDLGVRLPITTLFHAATIAQLSDTLAHRNEAMLRWSPVVPINTSKSKAPFFGVHGHEGGVLFWRDVVMQLPEDQPFYAIQAQGVDGVQPALTSIEDMASLYISAIREIQPHGPYYLGGFSIGGEIAFEMGQQLFRQGERVDLLVMLDTRNPARSGRPIVREDKGIPTPALVPRAYINPIEIWRQKVDGHLRQLSRLNPYERLTYIGRDVLYRVRRVFVYTLAKIFRLLRKRLPDSLLLQYLKISHSQAIRDYVPTLYPGRVTLFRSSDSLEKNPDKSPLGWGPLTDGRLDVFHFNASHNIVDADHAKEVAQRLNECLVKARGS